MGTLFSLVAIILSIIAISRTNDASIKIADLENKLKELGSGIISPVLSSSSEVVENSTTQNELINTQNIEIENAGIENVAVSYDNGVTESNKNNTIQPVAVIEDSESGLVKWLKEDWLLKFGGVLVLMGVLFFLNVAFLYIGPQGKIAVGYIFGVSLMLFGFKYAKKQLVGGSAVHLVGAIIVIITTYIAYRPGYDMFNPSLAMLLMFLTTVCLALTAFAYNRPPLAHVGLLLAAIVPILTGNLNQSFATTLIYLGVVTLGVLWLALVTKWRTLVLLACPAWTQECPMA